MRIPSGQSVESKHWDKKLLQVSKSHNNSGLLNSILRSKVNDMERVILEYQSRGINPSFNILKGVLTGNQHEFSEIKKYVTKLCGQLSGRLSSGTIRIYNDNINIIERFEPGVTFQRIDHNWLKNFEQDLRQQDYSNNSIHKAFKVLFRFFRQAQKDGVTTNDPFREFERPKYKQTERVHLSQSEVEQIESLLLMPLDDSIRKAATWFLFGCYSGLRFSDWKRFNPKMIQGDMLVLFAKKNGEMVAMPIHSKLRRVIQLLPEVTPVDTEPATNRLLKSVAKMAKIEKNISTHTGRHTFAVRCAELGIPKETTAAVMGINSRTVEVYYKVTGSKVKNDMMKWG